LDPRFKKLNFLSQDENTDTIERLKLEMLHTVSEELTTCGDSDAKSNEIDTTDSCTEINESLPPKKKQTCWQYPNFEIESSTT